MDIIRSVIVICKLSFGYGYKFIETPRVGIVHKADIIIRSKIIRIPRDGHAVSDIFYLQVGNAIVMVLGSRRNFSRHKCSFVRHLYIKRLHFDVQFEIVLSDIRRRRPSSDFGNIFRGGGSFRFDGIGKIRFVGDNDRCSPPAGCAFASQHGICPGATSNLLPRKNDGASCSELGVRRNKCTDFDISCRKQTP